ncbi:NUDIX [Urbanus proteus nucleopolyhedrovirus]|uniref:NUDIX n=1 Tax=Urbanus proteus nucleopolyhedrovirus TaxID=1675866 RepID=A0A161C6X8_9ABAC|nr:NUDIX [Urbanus proteus nucleopolyhedrovirus]AKR17345.1 NUDIX [Urbanus proteus nucleopolyhedrovirus]
MFNITTKMKCSGLLLIIKPNKAVLLCARQAYNSSKVYTRRIVDNVFLEKISIPRGKRDECDDNDYETAIREFIEETGTFFNEAYVYREPFMLHWRDGGVMYRYCVYVGVTEDLLQYVRREPNSFCVKLTCENPNNYSILFENRKYNNELSRFLYITPLECYFKYMYTKQLMTYERSNYIEFFEYVKRVKQAHDNKELDKFIKLTLSLSQSLIEQWKKRSFVVTAACKELKSIINSV